MLAAFGASDQGRQTMTTMVKHQGTVSVENGPIWTGNIPVPMWAWNASYGYFNWSWVPGHDDVFLWAMSKGGTLTLIHKSKKANLLGYVDALGPRELGSFLMEW